MPRLLATTLTAVPLLGGLGLLGQPRAAAAGLISFLMFMCNGIRWLGVTLSVVIALGLVGAFDPTARKENHASRATVEHRHRAGP